ncbi:hypothetical protein BCR43DRAFT_489240 [Syncephalastrum racemosum]|uniref:DUF4097 domain-containing protein n=1 Tax=Syncephalastrum racemosum TaxID=13706 RepID=A0A1X2HJY6_SYNRA|nr:hypothetical protein BCR43DRAFT_489240 [Syncephalastrum racemosum]
MSNYDNPKAYYNDAEYTPDPFASGSSGAGRSGSNSGRMDRKPVHKPDEPDSPAGPPPPYSPPPPTSSARTSNEHGYGALESQAGLLDPNNTTGLYPSPSPSSSSSPYQYQHQQHQQRQQQQQQQPLLSSPVPSPTSSTQRPSQKQQWSNPHLPRDWEQNRSHRPQQSQPGRRRLVNDGDEDDEDDDMDGGERGPGCCRKWCKYVFVAILIWIVALKYSDIIKVSPIHGGSCDGAVQWEGLPSRVAVEKNAWLTVEGRRIATGEVNVHYGGDEGAMAAKVYVSPASLKDDVVSYHLQEGDDTHLTIKADDRDDVCVKVEVDIWLPEKAERLEIRATNMAVRVLDALQKMDTTQITTSNAPIQLAAWEGDKLVLLTSNGEVELTSDVVADTAVYVQSSSAAIRVHHITAKHRIDLHTSNGAVLAGDGQTLQADDMISIQTSNGELDLGVLRSDAAELRSSNDRITVSAASIERTLKVDTANAPIAVRVLDVKDVQVALTTSNAEITAHMPNAFEGRFLLQTSRHNRVLVEDMKGNNIEYDEDKPYYKQGRRFSGKGTLSTRTTNADTSVVFDA